MHISKTSQGFTLVEMLVSLSILTILITVGTTSLVRLIGAHRETQEIQKTMNDLNFALESMSRHFRFGKNYQCAGGTNPCSDITVLFIQSGENEEIRYFLDEDGVVQRDREGGSPLAITSAQDVRIDTLDFHIRGAGSGDGHPRITMVIAGTALNNPDTESSDFVLQTTVNQRPNEPVTNY